MEACQQQESGEHEIEEKRENTQQQPST